MNQTTGTVVTLIGIIGAGIVGYFIGTNSGMNAMHNDMMNDTSMHSMMTSMTGSLAGKTGDAFDQAFIDEMIVHHQGAVVMAEMVLKSSQRPELQQLARDIIGAQTKEIQMMQDWKTAWFPSAE